MTSVAAQAKPIIGQYTWRDGHFYVRPQCSTIWVHLSMFFTLWSVNQQLIKECQEDGLPVPPSEGWLISVMLTRMGWSVASNEAPAVLDGCTSVPY